MSKSRWRNQARREIQEALASLPSTATVKEKRAVLKEVGRHYIAASWPYKCFLRERQEALVEVEGKERAKRPMVFRIEVVRRLNPERFPFLRVACSYCRGIKHGAGRRYRLKGGCLMCGNLHEEVAECVAFPEWRRFQDAAKDDPSTVPFIADWAEEHGFERVAAALREVAE